MAFREICGVELAQAERVVEASEPVAPQIDGHMRVAECPSARVDGFGRRGLDRASDLIAPELEPRNGVVMSNAANTESELVGELSRRAQSSGASRL